MNASDVKKVFQILRDRTTPVVDPETPFYRADRYAEYGKMLSSGEPAKVATVLRDLHIMNIGQEMSYGEKRLCDAAFDELLAQITETSGEAGEKVFALMKGALKDLQAQIKAVA